MKFLQTFMLVILNPPAVQMPIVSVDCSPILQTLTVSPAFTLDVRSLNQYFRLQGFYETSILFYTTIQLIALSLLAFSVLGLVYFGHTIGGVLTSATCLALFFQQAGWLAHDYCHNQVSDSKFFTQLGCTVWGPCAQGLSLYVEF